MTQPDSDLDGAGPPPVDPWPTLLPEFRLAFVLRSGFVEYTPVLSEQECIEITSRLRYAKWRLERRMCSPWVAAGPNMQTTVTVEQIDSIPELELRPETAEGGDGADAQEQR